KSTVGRLLAERLGYSYLDAGLLYRAVTSQAMEANVALDDEQAVAALAKEIDIQLRPLSSGDSHSGIVINGKEPRAELFTPQVERHVARLSHYSGVWQVIHELERQLG